MSSKLTLKSEQMPNILNKLKRELSGKTWTLAKKHLTRQKNRRLVPDMDASLR